MKLCRLVIFSVVLLGVTASGCRREGTDVKREPPASAGDEEIQADNGADGELKRNAALPEIPQVAVDEAKRRQIDRRLADLVRKTEHRRYNAANDLSGMGPAAAPGLITLLDHEDPEVRGLAAAALGWMAMIEARKANEGFSALLIPYLVKALGDDVSSVRRWSAEVLGKNGDRAVQAIPALCEAETDENADVRKAATEALRRIRQSSHESKSK